MNNFGENLKLQFRKKGISEKEIFINILEVLDGCKKRTDELEINFMLDMFSYEEDFYLIIENLLYIHYGELKTEIILWWVYSRFNENGGIDDLIITDENEESPEIVKIENVEQLWSYINKIKNK
jgi:hypothetical protein